MPRISFVRDFLPPASPSTRGTRGQLGNQEHSQHNSTDQLITSLENTVANIPNHDENLTDLHLELVEDEHRSLMPHYMQADDASALESEVEVPWDDNEPRNQERTISAVDSEIDVEAGQPSNINGSVLGPNNVPSSKRHRKGPNKKVKAQATVTLRTWLKIDQRGEASMLQTDKWRITHKLGIQTRDMRLLDPNLSTAYTSALLCREKAIVVSMEHIKVIITTSYVLVINHEDEKVARFVENLKRRLLPSAPNVDVGGEFRPPLSRRPSGSLGTAEVPLTTTAAMAAEEARLKTYLHTSSMSHTLGLELPFELKALEVCLDVMARHLDYLTTELESAAYPALDSLASKVSSVHLERVRRVKNALVRLTTRVETMRGVLEKFMDDDGDMHDLNLTAKELHEEEQRREFKMDAEHMLGGQLGRLSNSGSSVSSRSSGSSNSSIEEAETAVVEMLLETYFMNLDNTYNRLQTLHEYIGDTEDLVNIKLDQHRNQLITIDLMLTGYMAACATLSSISGWFGMNLESGLSELPYAFKEVVLSSNVGCLLLLGAFFLWLWRCKLI